MGYSEFLLLRRKSMKTKAISQEQEEELPVVAPRDLILVRRHSASNILEDHTSTSSLDSQEIPAITVDKGVANPAMEDIASPDLKSRNHSSPALSRPQLPHVTQEFLGPQHTLKPFPRHLHPRRDSKQSMMVLQKDEEGHTRMTSASDLFAVDEDVDDVVEYINLHSQTASLGHTGTCLYLRVGFLCKYMPVPVLGRGVSVITGFSIPQDEVSLSVNVCFYL